MISNRLRNVLSSNISLEKFGFFSSRVIHDAIGVAQEAILSIKIKKCNTIILKVDLVKTYDRVNWGFLRLLLDIFFDVQVTNSIMGCISFVSFAVLVSGSPFALFSASRGLRQGCPLSSLLFILFIEGLSGMISMAKSNGSLKGVKISKKHSSYSFSLCGQCLDLWRGIG